ncbi:ELP5 family protein [Heyndrickxia sporothermodurans]|uniref:hypothetical protein n=1 Tax=Heyndrickxia sporothermodurans TaxID=46224 RepID=UPI002DBFA903|nr:hypothetical protein [Heyndrickxia sporothermodurans]MEB6549685.1 ELP5 family protein [Heyndrickxia sporothermodurans]
MYTSVVFSVRKEKSMNVMSYDQYLQALANQEGDRTRADNLNEMFKKLIIYDVVYIISDSLDEGFELTSFFSSLVTPTVIVVTNNSRYYHLYKKLGVRLVIISKPGDYSYSWLQREFS